MHREPVPYRMGDTADADAARRFSADAVRAMKAADSAIPPTLGMLAAQAANRYATRVISPTMVAGLWRVAEFTMLATISMAVVAIQETADQVLWRHFIVSVGGAAAGVAAIQTFDGYEMSMLRRTLRQFVPVAGGWAIAIASIAAGSYCLTLWDDVARTWLALWYACGAGVLFGARLVLSMQVRRWTRKGMMERRAVIVGGGEAAERLIRAIDARPETGIRVCGIFDDRNDRRSPPLVGGHLKLGNVRELVEFSRRARIDMLIVTVPISAERRVLELLKSLWVLPLDIRLVAQGSELNSGTPSRASAAEIPLLPVFDKPIAEWNAIAKRVFDIIVASLALLALVPVFAAAALAIKLNSKGPILFRQKRHGFNNQIIEVLKFRSMYHEMSDPTARRVVTKGDPRVTSIGRFLRKSSVDELPQLWNVIRGDLSLVGPRPHAVHALSSNNEAFIEIVDDYFGRHKVKPGITGWAQVNGYRGEIDQAEKLRKRVEYDLHYIDNWSILFDVSILALTPIRLLRTENAY